MTILIVKEPPPVFPQTPFMLIVSSAVNAAALNYLFFINFQACLNLLIGSIKPKNKTSLIKTITKI